VSHGKYLHSLDLLEAELQTGAGATGGRAGFEALAEKPSVETSDWTVPTHLSGHLAVLVSTDARFASLLDQRRRHRLRTRLERCYGRIG
jgi:hypothetical protein